jgi:hypothetical protein
MNIIEIISNGKYDVILLKFPSLRKYEKIPAYNKKINDTTIFIPPKIK